MDEASFLWVFWVLLAIWRQLTSTKWVRQQVDKVERWLLETADLRRFLNRNGVGHHFALGTPIFEWWFIALFGITSMALRAFYDVVVYDYSGFHFLLPTRSYSYTAAIEDSFNKLKFTMPSELRKKLDIPLWLRGLAMAAPAVGVVAFVIFLVHIVGFVNSCKEERAREVELQNHKNDINVRGSKRNLFMVGARVKVEGRDKLGTVEVVHPEDILLTYKILFDPDRKRKTGCGNMAEAFKDAIKSLSGAPSSLIDEEESDWFSDAKVSGVQEDINPWVADVHEDLALLVVMMPAVFIVMAMRAEIRVIQIMTGSTLKEGQDWEEYEMPLMGTYTTDLELSSACQYITVFAFAILCTRFFNLNHLEKLIGGGQTKELLQTLRKKSKQHHCTLSLAGLLGVWGYVVVGVFRCIFNVFVAVKLERAHDVKGKNFIQNLQAMALEKIQQVFLFSMALCIVNMIVVLTTIEDLKDPAAFGVNANTKFIACRALLILSDGQMNFLMFITKHSSFSTYQAKLTHVSLLMVECLGLILFNSKMWTESVKTRSIKARDVVKRCHDVGKEFLPASRVFAEKEILFGSVVAPLVVLMFVLLITSAGGGGPVEHVPKLPAVIVIFDRLLQMLGPILVLPVLFLRRLQRHPGNEIIGESHDSTIAWLPGGWVAATLVVWLCICAARWVLFLLTHPFHDYFSDHIFLIISVIVMLQMEIIVGNMGWRKDRKNLSACAVLVCSWAFLFLVYWDAWNTAMYYHTVQAVWTAFGTGILLFGITAVWWLRLLLISSEDMAKNSRLANGRQPLLT